MNNEYSLIISILNSGFAGAAMDSAKTAGAGGGTIFHARGAGAKDAEKFFGISVLPEKDVLLILARGEMKTDIMNAISHSSGLTSEGRGVTFSLPVDDVAGVIRMMNSNVDAEKNNTEN